MPVSDAQNTEQHALVALESGYRLQVVTVHHGLDMSSAYHVLPDIAVSKSEPNETSSTTQKARSPIEHPVFGPFFLDYPASLPPGSSYPRPRAQDGT